MPSVFNYDVIISYKSEQESWAERLADTLESFGLIVWRDHNASGRGIRLGEMWSNEIKNAIRRSQIMIVLWSRLVAANLDTVVFEEIDEMEKYRQSDKTGKRRFIPIALDGEEIKYKKLSAWQADTASFKVLYDKVGDNGAYKISAIEWYGAIRELLEALDINEVMEIRFVVAAMTRAQAKELKAAPKTHAVDPGAFKLMRDMMAITSGFDITRYGDSPNDWKPFPASQSNLSVLQILDAYDKKKRSSAREAKQPAKWILVSYSEEILAPDPATSKWARDSLQKGLAMVIFDPVSLMHKTVYQQIITVASLHNLPESYVIGIAPFASSRHKDLYDTSVKIETKLKAFLQSAYDRFKEDFVHGNQACVMNIEWEDQFKRWLQVAGDNILLLKKTPLVYQRVHPTQKKRMEEMAANNPTADIARMR